MDSQGGDERGAPGSAPLLAVDEITQEFGGLRALSSVSLSVRQHSLSSLIGPNGAGKSTLFNIVTGVLRPTSGRVLLRNVDVTRWPSYRVTQAGVVRTFQEIRLFPTMTILENVMIARFGRTRASLAEAVFFLPRSGRELKANKAMAHELLDEMGVGHIALRFPRELPYGERRRAEIARALATEPELLMLDEPFAGMIHEEAWSLAEVLRRLCVSGKTIFLIEHNMEIVMTISDHVSVLNFGTLIADGSPDTVRTDPLVLEAYLGVD